MELKLFIDSLYDNSLGLLIVPYGIETYINRGHMSTRFAFNRTLWN